VPSTLVEARWGAYRQLVVIRQAAQRWRDVWERSWPAKDVEAIVELYADPVEYRALVLRQPELGRDGVRDYLQRNFAVEDDIECRFGTPVVGDDRAAVEWWSSWVEDGRRLTMAGSTFLRFDAAGRVVDHRDYWNEVDGQEPPFAGW
jgi:hypothetical protein